MKRVEERVGTKFLIKIFIFCFGELLFFFISSGNIFLFSGRRGDLGFWKGLQRCIRTVVKLVSLCNVKVYRKGVV